MSAILKFSFLFFRVPLSFFLLFFLSCCPAIIFLNASAPSIIPFPKNNTAFELRESSRDSTIANGSISRHGPICDRLNPEALTRSNMMLFSGNGITLEFAWTPSQISWGLMQRKHLLENHGMLFHYDKPASPLFWSFNCYIDLSVAFIDDKKVIKEIRHLRCHPEKMDPARPVKSLDDLSLYPPGDPIIEFFLANGVKPKTPIRYALEMNAGWFEKNGVRIGDSILFDTTSHTAVFRRP